MISKVMQTIITELPKAVNEPFKDNYLADYIANEAKEIIRDNAPEKYQDYFFKGSAGMGRWVSDKDAWIGIFNPNITKGASKGYYLVYGFPIGSNFVRFGIGQSFDEAQKRYKKNWEEAIDGLAKLSQLKIPSYSSRFPSGGVSFTKHNGESYYRSGFVYHRLYDINNLPDESELVEDLAIMLDAYEELYFAAGPRLDTSISHQNITSFESDEELYQSPPKKKTIKKSPKSSAIEAKELVQVKSSVSNVRPRNPDYGEEAKQNANHQCEISELHETFTRNKDDKNFTEAHHLIPYEQYDAFADKGLSLDRGCNIVSLCPNCHRNIHHGKKEDIGYLLEQLYKVRGQSLMEIYGCDINLLKSFYKAI